MNIINTTGYEMYNPSIIKADNCILTASDGKQYYDFESGVWALPLGHNDKRINEALIRQLNQITHVGYRCSHPVVEEAAEDLLEIMQFSEGKCVFLSSGSEAVEYAVRAAQAISDKPYLLCLDNHYLSAYGVTGDTKSSCWISIDWQTYIEKQQASSSSRSDIQMSYDDLLIPIPFDQIGAFVFEPGNTSGTAKLPPKELITAIVSRVKANKGFIVVDEVTTGMGRTGRWFGYEHYDIKPDIIACGKGLGNGYPVSAVGMNKETAKLVELSDFHHAQSHQNDPSGCAVAKEVIAVIRENELLDRATAMGQYLRDMLTKLSAKHLAIKEVRGVGLMCTIVFRDSCHNKLTDIHRKLYEAGFIVGLKPVANVMRFYPPLTIEKHMINEMLGALNSILRRYYERIYLTDRNAESPR